MTFFISYYTEGKQKRYIKEAFKQYLSPLVIEQLISNPGKLKLGGERREISMFFSDIEGFSSVSEKLSPEKLTEFLNIYLSKMTDIILNSGKLYGDKAAFIIKVGGVKSKNYVTKTYNDLINDVYYFGRQFKKYFFCTPQEMLKQKL